MPLGTSPSFTLKEKTFRIAHIRQASEEYTGSTYAVTLTSQKTALKNAVIANAATVDTAIDDAVVKINAFITANAPTFDSDPDLLAALNKCATAITELATLVTDNNTDVDTQLNAVTVPVSDVLDEVVGDMETKRSAQLTYPCTRCGQQGLYPYNTYAGGVDTTKIICKACKGHGAADVAITIQNPVHSEMEEILPEEA